MKCSLRVHLGHKSSVNCGWEQHLLCKSKVVFISELLDDLKYCYEHLLFIESALKSHGRLRNRRGPGNRKTWNQILKERTLNY